MDSVMQTPFKPIDFLSRDVRVERRGDGTILLQSNHRLKPYEKHVPAFLAKWAAEAPDRYIEPGEWGQPGKPVIRLIDPANLYVRAEIDEVDLARVKAGLPVRVLLDPYRGRNFSGKIARVAPVVSDAERQNRTLEIEVEFDGGLPVADLRTGTSADVEVILDKAENVLRVPAYAVIEGKRVLVLENGRAVERPVTTGLRNWEFVEIRSGLKPGDRVILTLDKAEVKAGAEVAATAD